MTRVLLLVPTRTYRTADFMAAAARLAVDVVVGSERRNALEALRQEGKIRLIGVSNFSLDQLRVAQSVTKISSVQNQFNRGLLTSENVLDACEAEGIAFMPWSPLGEALREPAYELRWLLDRSPVMLPIPGTSSVAHCEENMLAVAD